MVKPPVLMRTLPDGSQLGIEREGDAYFVTLRAAPCAEWERWLAGPFYAWTVAADRIDGIGAAVERATYAPDGR